MVFFVLLRDARLLRGRDYVRAFIVLFILYILCHAIYLHIIMIPRALANGPLPYHLGVLCYMYQ